MNYVVVVVDFVIAAAAAVDDFGAPGVLERVETSCERFQYGLDYRLLLLLLRLSSLIR